MGGISDNSVALIQMSTIMPTEEALRRSAASVAERYKTALAAVGVSFSSPELEVWNDEAGARTSEFRIWVYHDGNVEDVLEFHLFRDGRQIATESEIIRWLDEQISAMLK
jgi:hypothetical protein